MYKEHERHVPAGSAAEALPHLSGHALREQTAAILEFGYHTTWLYHCERNPTLLSCLLNWFPLPPPSPVTCPPYLSVSLSSLCVAGMASYASRRWRRDVASFNKMDIMGLGGSFIVFYLWDLLDTSFWR